MSTPRLSLDLTAAHGDRSSVLTVAGEIDLSTAEQLRQRLVSLASDGRHHRLVVDLSGVSFCDATGLSAFLAGLEESHKHGGWLRLCGLQPVVAKVFHITELDQVFEITPQEAGAHCQEKPQAGLSRLARHH